MQARILEHDQAGEGEPPLVLLPGGLTGWQSWMPLVGALCVDRRVIRLQPIANAEGQAGRLGDPTYNADVERESIRRTLDSLGIEDLHLAGWSNGGRMALDFALAFPERIHTLTMIEPAAWWLVGDSDRSAKEIAELFESWAGREITDDDLRTFFVLAGIVGVDVDITTLPSWEFWSSCRQTLSWCGERVLRSFAAGIEGFERLGTPTLLIRGRSTASWLAGTVGLLAAGLPKSTVVELDGGHACLLESAEGFVAAVRDHLSRQHRRHRTPIGRRL
jgi:pimeloyl-ACP methyl ester carboxylesterase